MQRWVLYWQNAPAIQHNKVWKTSKKGNNKVDKISSSEDTLETRGGAWWNAATIEQSTWESTIADK